MPLRTGREENIMICPKCGADLTDVIRQQGPARGRTIMIPRRFVNAGLAALAIAILAIIAAVITHHSNGTPVPAVRVVTVTPSLTVVPHVTVTTATAGTP